jgi:hypothetical protein
VALIDDLLRQARTRPHPAPEPLIISTAASGAVTVYALRALAGEAERISETGEGSRNDQLNTSAFRMGQLIGAGLIDANTVRDRLADAARICGLPEAEIATVLRGGPTSALECGMTVPRWPEPSELGQPYTYSEIPATEFDHGTEDDQLSTWHYSGLGDTMQAADDQQPSYLIRDDGQPLFYPGHVNGLIGESESGKGWVSLLAAGQAIGSGQTCLLLDFEDSAQAIHQRMTALGYGDDQLRLFHYAHPDEPLTGQARTDYASIVAARFGVVIVDGVNAAMAVLGLDINSNNDATVFAARILRPLAASGACVITVDHVPKDPDSRGKGGIGAQAKRAMIDGCALLATVTQPFGIGLSGAVQLTLDKDRHGTIRGIAGDGRLVGTACIESVAGQVRVHIQPPTTADRTDWQPTVKMAEIAKVLNDIGPLSFRQIKQLVTGRDETLRTALSALVAGGFVQVRPGPHRALIHTLARPYPGVTGE